MSEQTLRLVERMRARLQRATRRMTWAELAFGTAVAAGSLGSVWLLAAVLEATLWLGTGLRTALVLFGGASILGIVGAFVARPLFRLLGLLEGPSEEDVARTVGEQYPGVDDRLVNLLQLAEGRSTRAPAPYVDRAVQHLAAQIDEVPFEEVADFRPARKAARLAVLPLVAVLAFLLAAPSTFLGASERLLAPQTAFDRPAPFQLSVVPGNTRLVKGDSLRITVRSTGTGPESAALLLRQKEDDSPQRIALRADTVGTFRHTVSNVRQSLRYRVVAAPVRTEWYSVEVAKRPFLRRLQLRVVPPSYTNRPSRQLAPNVGSVTALPGSRVRISAALGGPTVAEAFLEFENGASQSLAVRGDSATGEFVLRREGSYVIRLQSKKDIPNRDPIRYETSLQADARPSVSFLKPKGTTTLTPSLTQQLRLQLSDDYGFRRARLFYRLVEDRSSASDSSFSSIALPLPQPRKVDPVITHNWLLAQESNLDLERGDEVVYYAKVWDNDTVNGPKSGRTVTQRLRFPSLTEQYEELEKLQEETEGKMRNLDRQSESVREQFRELRDELRRTREADWEDRRQLERMRQKQNSVEQGVEKLSRQVEKLNRKMQRNDLSSPEITKKFQELKRTVEEINSSKLQKTLKRLRKSMEAQNFPQMQQSLQNAKRRLEQYQRRLERTLNLFKQLQARQKLEEMRRRAQNLKEQEQEIAEKTADRMKQSTAADSSGQSEHESRASNTSPSDSTATPSPTDSTTTAQSDSTSAVQSDSTSTLRSDSTSATSAPPDSTANRDLATEQEQVAQQMKKLMETMKEAEREMQDVPSAPRKKLQKLNKQLQRQNLPRQMRKSSQQLRKNQLQNARQRQQQIQKRLQRMQSQLSQMQQQMKSQQRQMNMAGLRTALENTLRLSHKQEQLRTTVQELSNGPTVRRSAPKQKQLSEGLQHVADSLQSIASRLPEMSQAVQEMTGNALRAMEKATTSLSEREADQATAFQKTSMMHLNELALLLSDLLDQLKQKSGGGGSSMSMQQIMQALQKASGQQQKLNQQIQEFLNKVQGERLSKDMEKRRKQLAKQQRRIKQQLEEMNVGSEAQQKLLGDLQKIAEQMEKSADDLQRGRRTRELIERQQQILTRLLNAQKSLRTQGKKEQRRGRTADEDLERQRPGERPTQKEVDTLRRDLIRALEMGYNPDYETLIKRYFELLQKRKEPGTK